MKLEEIFSEDHVLKYANVCIDLAVDMPEVRISRESRAFDTLVIPSRGAVPFLLGMVYSLDKISNSFGGEHENFYNNFGIQKMVSSLLPENLRVEEGVNGKSVRVLLIPFTADLNVTRFDQRLDNDEFTLKTRRYWTNVTRSFFKQPSERSKDPYFVSFVDFILKDVEGRDELAKVYETFPAINRFSLIDTVISGRASAQILGAFEGMAARYENPSLNPSAFLIMDENGRKLRPEYSRYLSRRSHEEILDIYEIPRIVSEDEGASLLGVGAVVYPSIMSASREFDLNGEEFFIGAGGWHNSMNINGQYFDNFTSFMNMIYKGIDFIYSVKYLGEDGGKQKEIFDEYRKSFLARASKYRILDRTSDDVSLLHPSQNYSYGNCYETRSHVLHAPFTKESEERARSKIASIPNVRCWSGECDKYNTAHQNKKPH